MPDIMFDSVDAIPEGLRGTEVKGADGKFVVKVVPASKLDEFRNTNITVSKERDALAAFVNAVKPHVGEDPAAFAARLNELVALETSVKDGKLKGSDAIATEVENRVKAMKADYDRQNQGLSQELANAKREKEEADTRWRQSIIERSVTSAVVDEKSGALPGALPDILERAFKVFKVGADGRSLVAMDGQATIYGADGATPMSPAEWLAKLREQAPYFFKNSSGGGANGSGNGGNLIGGKTAAEIAKMSPEARLKHYYASQRK